MLKRLTCCLLLAASFFSHAHSEGSYDYIRKILIDTGNIVHDCDGDGVINCLDYACTFKYCWDKVYNPVNCRLVRNYKEHNGNIIMNHLFVRVRKSVDSEWVYVETRAIEVDERLNWITVEDYWQAAYDSRYNVLGEDYTWMKMCRYWR